MPAAAIDEIHRLWRTKQGQGKASYLFNHKALAKVFRAKMLDAIGQPGLELPLHYPETGVVDAKSVGTAEKALLYLGPPAHPDIGNRNPGMRLPSIALKYDQKCRFPQTVAAMATDMDYLEKLPTVAALQGQQA